MPQWQDVITRSFVTAIDAVCGPAGAGTDPLLRWTSSPAHGDLQANFAMGLAKRLGRAPRAVAEEVAARLDLAGVASEVAVAGPGFVNLRLEGSFLEGLLAQRATDKRCGIPPATIPERVVIDYSAPNVAKEMHVGHIRSTVIGDCLARVLGFLGHEVLRQNHLGDWGTQFGMLVEHVSGLGWTPGQPHEIGDLNSLYREAKTRFDAEPEFAERSRRRVVELQAGEPATLALWRELVRESLRHFAEVYQTLDVLLTDADYVGESFYNDQLAPLAAELLAEGLAVESGGAVCLFPPGFSNPEGQPLPLILRKRDGGFGYDATDLAALRHRVTGLRATRLIYVTDSRQRQHFAMVFAAAELMGLLPSGVRVEHVPFGTILGEDGKPFKTRSGDTVRLQDLLAEALERAEALVRQKAPDLPREEQREIARAVGIGALKYADLCNDRCKDYLFSWERMLAFNGNTAPYLQNAYVRIRSLFRKAREADAGSAGGRITLTAPEERALAIQLIRFGESVEQVAVTLEPHWLCSALYDLASSFHRFYEACPVLAASDDATRCSRLALAAQVADTLQLGLGLLGIRAVERM